MKNRKCLKDPIEILESTCKVTKIKKIQYNSKFELVEEIISELPDRSIEIIQCEERELKINKNEQILQRPTYSK